VRTLPPPRLDDALCFIDIAYIPYLSAALTALWIHDPASRQYALKVKASLMPATAQDVLDRLDATQTLLQEWKGTHIGIIDHMDRDFGSKLSLIQNILSGIEANTAANSNENLQQIITLLMGVL
jgi:hypothetical protein